MEEIGGHPLIQYNLTINNPSTLGDVTPNRIRDIELAINLTLREIALSPVRLDLTQPFGRLMKELRSRKM